ncbi:hypothetical protein HDU88_008363 [Geranomyces variabilis]|nr:hypothetical protein HDU88_008363 [Geranomyces variabilis]
MEYPDGHLFLHEVDSANVPAGPKDKHNKLKRLYQGDEELTENTARARKKSIRASEKVDEILGSDVWRRQRHHRYLKEVAGFFKSGQGVEVIDLRTSFTKRLLKLSNNQAERYAAFVEQRFANPLSETSHDVLETLFNKLRRAKVSEWERIGEEGVEREDQDTEKLLAVIRTTLPAFSQAFARGDNPLTNRATLESEHMQEFIHPIFRESCHQFATGVKWRSREISSNYFVKRTKADAVAHMTKRDNLPLGYLEGARPVSTKRKKRADEEKIIQNVTIMFTTNIKKLLTDKRRLPDSVMGFAAQSSGLQITCSVLEFHTQLFLHEYYQASVPGRIRARTVAIQTG